MHFTATPVTAFHTPVECAAWAPQRFELETHVGPVDSLCDLVKAMLQSSDNWGAAVTFCETVMSLKEAAERDRERSPAARANASSRGRRPSAGTRRGSNARSLPHYSVTSIADGALPRAYYCCSVIAPDRRVSFP
ncbi:hypothetical protein K1T71_003943 [Dendrolimus kikuchii]|uniref:Uncharacterized protein n=1 Tax=Dendrolimus kikuchii TaxID=765133 RepID=A0ACC1D9E0_9NEOP|nr:hypothetical protein K1T71_003943 [Dendrolimus kikuchii]